MISWLMIAGIVFVALVVAAFFIFSRGTTDPPKGRMAGLDDPFLIG
jgi:hypothetical protein